MTMKDFMTAVAATTTDADLRTFATDYIAKIEDKNAKRRNTPTKAQTANADLVATIVANMSAGDVLTAADVAKSLGVTTQKASALLQNGVKSGFLTAVDVKGKSGKVKGYSLVSA